MKSKIFKKLLCSDISDDKQKILNIQEDAFKILEQMEEKPEELLLEKIGIKNKNNLKLSKEYSSGYLTFIENKGILMISDLEYIGVDKQDIRDFVFFDIKRFYDLEKIIKIFEKIFIGMGIIGLLFVPNIVWKIIVSWTGSLLFLALIIIENVALN